MKPLKIVVPDLSTEPVTLRCTHAKLWPPPLMTLDVNVEQMWTGGEISQHDYQQIETWRRICGVLEMGTKCVGCPLAKLEKPRLGVEHHGRKDMVGLHDEIRSALRDRNKQARLDQGPTPAPVTEPAPVPGAPEPAEPVTPENFDAEPEAFRDETVKVTEPEYPIPENGNGDAHVENFDSQPEAPKAEGEDELDEILDGLDD